MLQACQLLQVSQAPGDSKLTVQRSRSRSCGRVQRLIKFITRCVTYIAPVPLGPSTHPPSPFPAVPPCPHSLSFSTSPSISS
jgi:hypothetical protein